MMLHLLAYPLCVHSGCWKEGEAARRKTAHQKAADHKTPDCQNTRLRSLINNVAAQMVLQSLCSAKG
jgi:hypothetical protein